MKYMGSKRELLERIEVIVDKKLGRNEVLLDLFSGTCGVGMYLRDKYPVYSNDIQFYSKVISEGTLEVSPINISRGEIWSLLERNYEKNYEFVYSRLSNYIKESVFFKIIHYWEN